MTRQTATQTHQQKPAATSTVGNLIQRKCDCGNHTMAGGECEECKKKKSGLQRKLMVGVSNDPLEQEADLVAEQVMANSTPTGITTVLPRIQRFYGQSKEGVGEDTASVSRVLSGSGKPLEPALLQDMEARFGYDFSKVRVHIGSEAAESARIVNARAYTIGRDVVFGAGQYFPNSEEGKKLLTHELTHVVQQNGKMATVQRKKLKTPYKAQIVLVKEDGGIIRTYRDVNANGCRTDVLTPGMEVTITEEFVGGAWLFAQNLPKAAVKALGGQTWIYVLAKNVEYLPAAKEQPAPKISETKTDEKIIEVELVSSRDDYQPPGSRERYRVGDAAASRVLLDIQEQGALVIFRVFNFETGAAEEISPAEWSFFRGAAIIGGGNAAITRLGKQLSPSQWRSLWPNPMPQILRMFESGQLNLEDEALLSGYRGMIRSDAAHSLDENERAIDEILSVSDRVNRIRDFASGLREASLVRDALVQRQEELSRRLVAQHSFTFGLPHAGTGPNVVQQLNIQRERGEVENALSFWLSAFPLLTRLQTQQISAEAVEARLREIKTNIMSTREQLNRGRLDPMTLDTVRARLAGRLGPRATAVVEAEDRSRERWAIVGAVGMTAAAIGILFLPGGVFVDAAIGVAIAGHAVANAAELGRVANTGLHVDEGLVSQSQAQVARFAAVLATVFAVVGAASAGFRVLRVGLALRGLGRSMPELALAERGAVARAIADDPALLTTFTRMAPGDAAVSARVAAAVRQAGGDVRALRSALADVARIAAIPRRVPTGSDLYEPLRRIADGSDLERIATQTGLTRAEVEAAKRNLMFDEQILVDDVTGALYRGRFTPFDRVADVWGRAARGEVLAEADRQFLRRLVRHEQVESALLSSSGRTLEQAFLRGELEGQLRRFLQSQGWNQARIERMLASEPRPMTPYRYAHLVTALSGAPNP